jgi:DNA primase
MDAIAYVKKKHNLDFRDACDWLASWAGVSGITRKAEKRKPRSKAGPPLDLQDAFGQIVEECAQALWSDAGQQARQWLADRGLKEQALRTWQIGFNKARDPARGRKLHGQWVWHGIVIPWQAGNRIWGINVRRSNGDKYKMVKGSRRGGALYGVNHLVCRKDLVVVEGEFDAILLWQEAGDLVDVLTLGGAGGRLSPRWLPALLSAERVWIATDSDEGGNDAAAYWMELVGGRGRRVFPGAKDVTEAWQAGHDLREWVQTFLATE